MLEFRNLVDNQPQLIFSATARERSDFVGPDEQMVSLVFEIPMGGNLRGFDRKHRSNSCRNWESESCLESFRDYVAAQSQLSTLAPRFALSIEYGKIDDYNFSLNDPMVSVSQKGSRKLIASATYGMRFKGDGATKDTRLDIAIKFEDLSDDPMRNDRTVASATWTKQFFGMSIPVSLIYSNKPEFIDQQMPGQRLSANIGLKYEFRQHEK